MQRQPKGRQTLTPCLPPLLWNGQERFCSHTQFMSSEQPRAVSDKHTTTVETEKYEFVACAMQGWRKTMEDAHVLEFEVLNDRRNFLLAVFDGHNGGKIAKWCSENLARVLTSSPSWAAADYKAALTESYLTMDRELRGVFGAADDGGCTAVSVLCIDNRLYCANVGDSRAVLYRAGDAVVPLSYDHKPTEQAEIDRVVAAGGTVSGGRVGGMLALTRALGDFELKEPGVEPLKQIISPMPDVREEAFVPNSDKFIVVACDGIWETKTNEDVGRVLEDALRSVDNDLGLACEALLDQCTASCNYGLGTDNMTVLVVRRRL